MQKTKKELILTAILLIAMMAISILSAGALQSNTSTGPQKSDTAAYTGCLVSIGTYWYPIRSFGASSSVSGNIVGLTFSDGRTFTANKTLVENGNLQLKSTYTVYYNISEPTVAISLVKLLTPDSNSTTPSPTS